MKSINLLYWRNSINFGDQLSPWIVKRLSGKNIQYKDHYSGCFANAIKIFIYRVLHAEFSTLNEILWPWQSNLVAVGSVLKYGNARSVVWGSGYMNENEKGILPKNVLALRGRFSAEKLKMAKGPNCSVFGDPALLLPLLESPSQKRFNIGFVPHWRDFESVRMRLDSQMHLIDLKSDDVEFVISQITSCELVLSSSLHGIIVAHAYNIPALWVHVGDIGTDGIKFKDYFSSVGIPFYKPFDIGTVVSAGINGVITLFANNKTLVLPSINIRTIQKDLLRVFPFKLTCQIDD